MRSLTLVNPNPNLACELMLPADNLLHPGYKPRRGNVVGLAHDSYLPWIDVKRRSSEPTAYSQREQVKPKSSEWFVREESESSFLSKMFSWNKGTKSAEEQGIGMKGPHR